MKASSKFYFRSSEGLIGPIAGDSMKYGYEDKSILRKALAWAKAIGYTEVHERVSNERLTKIHRVQ